MIPDLHLLKLQHNEWKFYKLLRPIYKISLKKKTSCISRNFVFEWMFQQIVFFDFRVFLILIANTLLFYLSVIYLQQNMETMVRFPRNISQMFLFSWINQSYGKKNLNLSFSFTKNKINLICHFPNHFLYHVAHSELKNLPGKMPTSSIILLLI